MKLLTAVVMFAAVASAQNTPANPLSLVSKSIYGMAKKNILGSVDKVPEEMWSYQPTKEVRTFAQLFAHIADGQYEFCGVAAEGKSVQKDIEKTAKTKAEIVTALKDAFAYCEFRIRRAYRANGGEQRNQSGKPRTRFGWLNWNLWHTWEHCENVVVYLRMNSLVPPSSERRQTK